MKSLFPKALNPFFTDIDFLYEKMVCPHVHPMGYSGFQFFFSKTEKYGSQFFVYFQKALNPISFVFQKALNPLFGGACNI